MLKKKKKPAKPKSEAKTAKAKAKAKAPKKVVKTARAQKAQQEAPGADRSRSKSRVRELTWAHFDRMVQGLARDIYEEFRPHAVVGVAHGGVFVGGALASALGAEFFPVRITRRSRDQKLRQEPRVSDEMPKELKGKRVLMVDDVAASGDTLELALRLAREAGAAELKTACLIQREEGYRPDFSGLLTDELVVFPWDYEPVAEDGRFDVDRR